MRLRRLELIIIGITLAFVCFLGGYFTGVKSSVNIVSVAAQDGQIITSSVAAQTPGGGALQTPVGSAPSVTVPAALPPAPDSAVVASPDAGQQVAADTAEPAAEPAGSIRDAAGRINVNLASRSELMDLPGIGNVLAERIVEYRIQNGVFKRIEDLRNVSGIGEKRFEAIKDRITVG